jgi:hypothetical protein
MKLAEQAAKEEDPARFLQLIQELNELLQDKRKRLDADRGDSSKP